LEGIANSVGNQFVDRVKKLSDNQDALADEVLSVRFRRQFPEIQKLFAPFEERRKTQFVSFCELLRRTIDVRFVGTLMTHMEFARALNGLHINAVMY
jgi:hypothetical protein